MVGRKAVINAGVVENVILADDDFEIDGRQLVALPEGSTVAPGWTCDGEEFAPSVPTTPTPEQIDAERDRRVAGGFDFSGVRYQSRQGDRENIAGASVAALAAMMAGVQPGNLRWHGGDSDFAWIAEDNSLTPMDAQTMFVFGQAAMAHKQRLIFAARALKDTDPIPADFADESYWT